MKKEVSGAGSWGEEERRGKEDEEENEPVVQQGKVWRIAQELLSVVQYRKAEVK